MLGMIGQREGVVADRDCGAWSSMEVAAGFSPRPNSSVRSTQTQRRVLQQPRRLMMMGCLPRFSNISPCGTIQYTVDRRPVTRQPSNLCSTNVLSSASIALKAPRHARAHYKQRQSRRLR
jgi:hypothetical protein